MARMQETDTQLGFYTEPDSDLETHAVYEVKCEKGKNVGIKILTLYFGELWQSALDRLSYRFDGHMFCIRHEGATYSVYRKLEPENEDPTCRLQLVQDTSA